MGKKSLLDDDEPVELGGPLTVNEEFAKRFQHNKEREERHRLEAKYPHLAAKRVLKVRHLFCVLRYVLHVSKRNFLVHGRCV